MQHEARRTWFRVVARMLATALPLAMVLLATIAVALGEPTAGVAIFIAGFLIALENVLGVGGRLRDAPRPWDGSRTLRMEPIPPLVTTPAADPPVRPLFAGPLPAPCYTRSRTSVSIRALDMEATRVAAPDSETLLCASRFSHVQVTLPLRSSYVAASTK